MAYEFENLSTEEIYKQPIPNIIDQRVAAARIVASTGSGENPIAMVNAHNLTETKKKIIRASFDKQGITITMSAIDLAADSQRPIRHSRTLATNLKKAGIIRFDWMDAHHIVGRLDMQAFDSRLIIFSKGIAINDADNGCYLPRYRTSVVASMPNAHNHQGLHTGTYYLTVYARLVAVAGQPVATVRNELRKIKAELIAGTFPI
jgi:hypothetical protein